jgi:putative ABC transport system permease protein
VNPTILGIRVSMLLRFYGWRLRRHGAQELLAGSGIAVGVALVFGVLVANTSLTSAAGQLVHGLVGGARLQLAARSEAGVGEGLVQKAARLPGVKVATGLLRANVTLVGPTGRRSLQMIGVGVGSLKLYGAAQRSFAGNTALLTGGLGLSSEVAEAIGVTTGGSLTVLANGQAHRMTVGVVAAGTPAGSIADSAVAVALLPYVQVLAGTPGRVSEILIEPRPGAEGLVAAELGGLAAGRLDVEPADNELRLLARATKPNSQSTRLFSAISVMVGILLALNAMLLTLPERRRFIADLRLQGYDWRQVLLLIGFEALLLGVVASGVGIAFGEVLSRTFFDRAPTYLASAFPVGSQQVIDTSAVALALICGVLATLLASLPLLSDLRPGRAADRVFREAGGEGETIDRRLAMRLGLGGVLLAVAVTAAILLAPGSTVVAGGALALTTLCLVPILFSGTARSLLRISEGLHSSALVVAASELRATGTRSVALAGIAALAVYGSVAIGGARDDLLRGIDDATHQYFDTADLWVSESGDVFNTDNFSVAGLPSKLAGVPGVASTRIYRGGLLDLGTRRMWVRARPAGDPAMLESSQIVSGNYARATELLRRGGWIAISSDFAAERGLRVGGQLSLPTPSGPARFAVAALMTNSGWPPGAITINAADYVRHWGGGAAAALEIDLKPGANVARTTRAVRAALRGHPGLQVRTSAEREVESKANAAEGLRTLSEISTLLLVAAALAVASALSATVWQRRARLAALKIQGYDHRQLWRALLLESTVMLGIGCSIGALVGIYGHALASRWLELTTGFPAPFSVGAPQVLLTFALVTGIALAVIALPGLAAARVPARASFQE